MLPLLSYSLYKREGMKVTPHQFLFVKKVYLSKEKTGLKALHNWVSRDIFKGLLFMIKITFFMQIFLATYTARKKEKIFHFATKPFKSFILFYCILSHHIFILLADFSFLTLYCQRLKDEESFGCIAEERRTSSMHFRDLLRKDSRSSTVYIRNTSSVRRWKANSKAKHLCFSFKKEKKLKIRTLQKQELKKNLNRLKQSNHQVGQMLPPQIKVCFT